MPRTVHVIVNVPSEESSDGVGAADWRDDPDDLPIYGPDDKHYVVTVPDPAAGDPAAITAAMDAFLGDYDLPDGWECGPALGPEAPEPASAPPTPSLTIPESAWKAVYQPDEDEEDPRYLDPKLRLHAEVTVCGTLFHADAWAVDDQLGFQAALVELEDLGAIHGAVHADGPFETVTLFGREYVIVLTPYC